LTRLATTLAPLQHRDFRRLWAGTFFATGGQWIQQATLGWVVYEVTASASVLGAVLGVRAVPMLLLAPVSGVVADRFDRRYALAASEFLMVAISIALAALLALNKVLVWHLFAFSVVAGVSAVFDRTLRSTLVFQSVPRAEAGNAVALNSIAFSVMRAVGPGVAGFLIGSVGAALNFAIQSLLYLGVAFAALSVNAAPPTARRAPANSMWAEMKEGVRFTFTDPIARMMVVLGLVPPILLIPSLGALMPVFGGLVAAWIARYDQTGLIQTLALAVFAFSLIAFALSPELRIAVVFLVLAGIAEMVHHTVHVTTLQMCAPEHMRGRVASLLPVFPAFISIGALLAGVCADFLGPGTVVILFAVLALTVVITAWARSTALREVRMSGLITGGNK
jgi:MFS family permease